MPFKESRYWHCERPTAAYDNSTLLYQFRSSTRIRPGTTLAHSIMITTFVDFTSFLPTDYNSVATSRKTQEKL
ncbi:hypothetical protein ABEB36_006031 [Hypothenemus hampei]|uniref:Uncharacterized protein n=1 Tax=Hypothenemus hampei TaxID=57062 RepID=A0ABD1F096_HYPHA